MYWKNWIFVVWNLVGFSLFILEVHKRKKNNKSNNNLNEPCDMTVFSGVFVVHSGRRQRINTLTVCRVFDTCAWHINRDDCFVYYIDLGQACAHIHTSISNWLRIMLYAKKSIEHAKWLRWRRQWRRRPNVDSSNSHSQVRRAWMMCSALVHVVRCARCRRLHLLYENRCGHLVKWRIDSSLHSLSHATKTACSDWSTHLILRLLPMHIAALQRQTGVEFLCFLFRKINCRRSCRVPIYVAFIFTEPTATGNAQAQDYMNS